MANEGGGGGARYAGNGGEEMSHWNIATVDGPTEEILHQLKTVIYPMIYRVLTIQSGAGFLPSTVSLGISMERTSDPTQMVGFSRFEH